jgi:hypothetical protein
MGPKWKKKIWDQNDYMPQECLGVCSGDQERHGHGTETSRRWRNTKIFLPAIDNNDGNGTDKSPGLNDFT